MFLSFKKNQANYKQMIRRHNVVFFYFVHLTSTDLLNWEKAGEVNAYGETIRHGTMNKLTDTKGINIIQELYNEGGIQNGFQ